MLSAERQNLIVKLVEQHGAIRTMDLAKRLEVTDETIRRDLDFLNSNARIMRTHGGAMAMTYPMQELTLGEREVLNMDEKCAIAKEAADLISIRDIIYMDSSSTVLQMCKYMPAFEFTVISNAHKAITGLSDKNNIRIIGTGGTFEDSTKSYVGSSVIDVTKRYNINKCFCSANGVDIERGFSDIYERQATLKNHIIPYVEETYVLLDHTKLSAKSMYFFSLLNEVTAVITDSKADDEEIENLREHVKVIRIK